MHGHSDTVTGLCLSPDGSFVLSNAMDCTGKFKFLKLKKNYFFSTHLGYSSLFNFTKMCKNIEWTST